MAVGRKAIYFSVSAILIMAILFSVFSDAPKRETSSLQLQRVTNLLEDYDYLENNLLPAITQHHVRRTLRHMGWYATDNPYPSIQSISDNLTICLRYANKTDSVSEQECGKIGVDTFLFDDLKLIEQIYRDNLTYDVTIRFVNLTIAQHSAFEIRILANYQVNFTDSLVAKLSKNISYVDVMSIEGLVDPISSNLTRTNRTIIRYELPLDDQGDPVDWNISLFFDHVSKQTFVQDDRAPSYLQRMQGNLSVDPVDSSYGIHSILPEGDHPLKAITGYENYNFSYVDYKMYYLYQPNEDCELYQLKNASGHDKQLYLDSYYVGFYRLFDTNYIIEPAGCVT